MNGSLERSGAGNRHAGCSGTTLLGESMWKFRARTASLYFDHTVLAELIARRWKEDARICLGCVPDGRGLSDSLRRASAARLGCRNLDRCHQRSAGAAILTDSTKGDLL
jgi:hypothetical protein